MDRGFAAVGLCLDLYLAGCNGSPTALGRVPATTVVTGVVRDEGGVRVPHAGVVLLPVELDGGTQQFRGCRGTPEEAHSTQADSAGRYFVPFELAGHPVDVCIIAVASALTSTGALSGVAELDSVRLGPGAPDSVFITVTLNQR